MRLGHLRQVLIIAALAVAVTAFLAIVIVHRGFFDLNVYHGALNYWVHDGGQLYDYLRPRTEYGFTYPPFAALVMLPMAFVPWPVAIVVSAALTAGSAVLLLHWLVTPIARRHGWTPWFAVAIAVCLAAAFEPMRETFAFGQVNAVLVALVLGDAVLLVSREGRFAGGRLGRFAGVGIGLATAIKLTPGIFIVFLLVVRRWRAAAVASATAAGATLLAAAIAPDASRIFWTEAIWNTDRVGDLSYISNQSVQGMLARLDPTDPGNGIWLVTVLAVLAVWAWRVWRADLLTGVALTGVVGCLISPVTWIHHLVWLIPAFVLLVDRALIAAGRRRWVLLGVAVAGYALLCSRLVWAFRVNFHGIEGFVFSNAYLWVSLALLVGLLTRAPSAPAADAQDVTDLGEVDGLPARALHTKRVPLPVRR
jgi:alpha-1,2-mannosyltransferase